jgi:hypothetical protein
MMNFSLFMRGLFKSIAPCPFLSDEVADVLRDGIRDWRRQVLW